jgi:hypothetical protein
MTPESSGRANHQTRWIIAVLIVVFHVCGLPFAAFGCLLGGALVAVTNLHHP